MPRKLLLCAIINGPSAEEAEQQIAYSEQYASILEFRLDLFHKLDNKSISLLCNKTNLPILFTLRSVAEGGLYNGSVNEKLSLIESLLSIHPEYLDLEHNTPIDFILKIKSSYPTTKIILSYHNFKCTPTNLKSIYDRMVKKNTDFYKIAVQTHSTIDALKLLKFAQEIDPIRIIPIGMGFFGQITRILSTNITYATVKEENNNLGQLSLKTLATRYNCGYQSSTKNIYCLIGDPITESISDHTHNDIFIKNKLNAVYIKMSIRVDELSDFFKIIPHFNIKGLSVTMPLKEAVMPFLDIICTKAQLIGAVNSITIEKNILFGFNTDGIGAIQAIKRAIGPLTKKKIVIIGAGGAAKAIAYEVKNNGAILTVINRNIDKAKSIASLLECSFSSLNDAHPPKDYDIIINCTPISNKILEHYIIEQSVVMDITTKPKITEFLQCAQKKNCIIIYGYKMFIEQAIYQFKKWIKPSIDEDVYRLYLEKKSLNALFKYRT